MNFKKTTLGGKLISVTIILCLLISVLNLTSCSLNPDDLFPTDVGTFSNSTYGGSLEVQFIDVGQADSSLIKLPDKRVIMIDCGGNSTASDLVNNLKNQGITKINHLIATHPHEDHIGGTAKVIDSFDIENFYMPEVDDEQIPTTKTYENVLTSVKNKGLKITKGKAGMSIINETDLKFEFLAPNSTKYDGLNSYSIVAKLTYGDKSFLFMGDAESDSEKEILNKGFDVKADVLKCGHHGSSSSTTNKFLKACNPSYAVISCSADNKYGHPHKETISLLDKFNIKTYITAKVGTITMNCDKKTINVKTDH